MSDDTFPEIAHLMMEIGHAGKLHRNALRNMVREVVKIIARVSPMTTIDIAIGGYDDDPRELHEIPEVRRYVLDFVDGLIKAGVPSERLLPVARQFIQQCAAVEQGMKVKVIGEPQIDITEEVKAYRERVRKSMH